jgi:hypothetical protein
LPRQAGLQHTLQDFIRDNRLSAVAKTVMADDFEHGVSTLLQVAGLGPVQPNSVLLGWSDDEIKQQVFARTVRRILQLEKNLLIFAEADLPQRQLQRHIDVWWRAKENGSLMVTLAHLLRPNPEWRRHRIRVLRIIPDEAGQAEAEAALRKLMADARFRVSVQVIVSRDEPLEVIARESEFSSVCFVGMAMQALAAQERPLAGYAPLVARLKGDIFLTKSWHDLEL